jgi:flagellin
MAQVINTNVSALFSAQSLNKSNINLQTAMQRLSSGLRINSAKDDPTGLVNATGFSSQIRGANQAARNAADGISKAQTNDGYLQQITDNLQRLRELAVQMAGSASVTVGGVAGTGLATGPETEALIAENTRITALMNTATENVVVNSDGGLVSTKGAQLAGANALTGVAAVGVSVTQLDTDLATVNAMRANYGSDMQTLSSAVANLQVQSVNLSAQFSRVMDTDYAAETGNMTRNQILQQAGTAMLAQANQVPNGVLALLR